MGFEVRLMGVTPSPVGYPQNPMGDEPAGRASESLPLVSDGLPARSLESTPASNPSHIPMGVEASPMGFELTPTGLQGNTGAASQPPLSFRAPPTVPRSEEHTSEL